MNKNINIPNGLSALRLLLFPAFAWLFLTGRVIGAVAVLVLSGLSDLFDGLIARRLGQITDLGKMLDPLADKLTQGVVACCLAYTHPVLWPILILFIVKECSMLAGGMFLLKKGKRPCAARWYGKVATTLFYFTFIYLVASEWWGFANPAVTLTMLLVTAAVMLYAWARYFLVFLRILRGEEKTP